LANDLFVHECEFLYSCLLNETQRLKLEPAVKIVIENLARKELAGNERGRTFLYWLRLGEQDWMHACGGKGRCTTCKLRVVEGMDALSAISHAEESYRATGELKQNERLACQAQVFGHCRIAVPDECKLPHLKYD
jgi:ferredoxin, 2Fe-2S